MKSFLSVIVILVLVVTNGYCSLPVTTSALFETDSAVCISLKGKVTGKRGNIEYKVDLFSKGKIIKTFSVKEGLSFSLELEKNDHYTVRISHPEYVSKLIMVNTSFPDDIDDVLAFSFKTDLITLEESKELNADALDFPIALVYFDHDTEMFINNDEYTKQIKSEIAQRPVKSSNKLAANN